MRGETLADADVVVAADLLGRLDQAVAALARERAACVLSGGLDSAVLVALLARAAKLSAAYTLASDFEDEEELERALASAAHAQVAQHRVIHVRDDDLPARFADAVRANRAPVLNGKAVANFVLLEALAAGGERRFLSGLGADERLGGDPVGQARWRSALDDDRAFAATLEQPPGERPPPLSPDEVLAQVTLPPTVNAGAALGLTAGLPYLHPYVTGWAAARPRASFQRGTLGKWPLRAAARGLVPDRLRFLPKTARLAPAGGSSDAARAAWSDLLAAWLTPARLGALVAPAIDAARVSDARDRHAGLPDADPERARLDRVLLSIASRVVLAEMPAAG